MFIVNFVKKKLFTTAVFAQYNERNYKRGVIMSKSELKLCPFCESPMLLIQDNKNNGEPYFECSTCGLKFKIEGFDEKPVEIKEN